MSPIPPATRLTSTTHPTPGTTRFLALLVGVGTPLAGRPLHRAGRAASIDLDHRIIPDVISIPGIAVGFGISFFLRNPSWTESLIGTLAGGGSLYLVATAYEALTKREGMGGGDVKLLAMIGAWLGWKAVLFTLFFASLSGTVIGGGAMLAMKEGRHYAIPFGPFLAFGALAYLFFGPQLIVWYLNFGKP